jgi:hypothetical protein
MQRDRIQSRCDRAASPCRIGDPESFARASPSNGLGSSICLCPSVASNGQRRPVGPPRAESNRRIWTHHAVTVPFAPNSTHTLIVSTSATNVTVTVTSQCWSTSVTVTSQRWSTSVSVIPTEHAYVG